MKKVKFKKILRQLLTAVIVFIGLTYLSTSAKTVHKLRGADSNDLGASIYDVFPEDFLHKIQNTEGINLSIVDKECIEYPENSGRYVARYSITFDSFLVSGSDNAPVPARDADWVFTDSYNWNHEAYLYIPFRDENCDCIENMNGTVGKAFIHIKGGRTKFIPEDSEVTMALPIAAKIRIPAMTLYGVPMADTPTQKYYSIVERGEEFLDTGVLSVEMVNYMSLAVMRGITAISEFLAQITGDGEKVTITDAVVSGRSKRGLTTYISAMLDNRIKGILPYGFTGHIKRHVPCTDNTYAYVCVGDWRVNRDRFCSDLWIKNYDPYFHVNDSRLGEVSLFFTSSTNDYMVPLTTGKEFYESWNGEKYFFHLTHSGHGGGHPPCDPTNYGKLQPHANLDNTLAFTYKVLMDPEQEFPSIENIATMLIRPTDILYARSVISTSDSNPEVAFYYSFFNLAEDFDEYGDIKSDFFSLEIDEGECADVPVECFRDFTTNQWFRIGMRYSDAEKGYILNQPLDVSDHMKGDEVLIYFVEVVSDTITGPVHITSVFDRLLLK